MPQLRSASSSRRWTTGNHVGLIYRTERERFSVLVPFVKDGLKRNECVLYLRDEQPLAPVLKALEAAGVDTALERSRGALVFITREQAYVTGERFLPKKMLTTFSDLRDKKRKRGFKAIRAAGDLTWALCEERHGEKVLDYEQELNFRLSDGVVCLCQYNEERCPGALMEEILRTHPHRVAQRLKAGV